MVGRITPDFKERLLARVDIVDIIGLRVQLKKAGKEFTACCPFHAEKTPSFTVSAQKQFYHCFGCGAHGNAIDFLIEYDRLSYPEAVEELAQRAGLDLPEDDGPSGRPQGPDPKPIYATLASAAKLYQRQLREHPSAAPAVEYLKGRGLSGEIVQRFGLGYAPPEWDFLLRALGTDAAARRRLVDAGLLADKDGRRYDRLRDRVLFPIRDRRGRVTGFGGRVLGDGKPKYLNSPETAVFHKGRELYGLFEAQQAERSPPRMLVVEGYMDVIALAQFGIPYAVATLGTATTPEHIKRLLRSAPELVFCFDGDRAGRAAAWKALQTALPASDGRQPIRFLFLPEGEDPDSLVRGEGREGFEQRLAGAALLSDFLFEHLTAGVDLASAEGRAKLDADGRALLATMAPGTYHGLLEDRLRALVGLSPAGSPRPAYGRTTNRRGGPAAQRGLPKLTPTRLAVALLLDEPALAPAAAQQPADWRQLDGPGIALLGEILDIVAAYPDISSAALCERWREHAHAAAVRRLSDSSLIAHIPADGRQAELIGAIGQLNRQAADEARRRRLLGLTGSGSSGKADDTDHPDSISPPHDKPG